jgi:hypothetical protein
VEATGFISCSCKIERNAIVFCPLHASAENLLAACSYVRGVLAGIDGLEKGKAALIRDVVLPYLDDIVSRAERKAS